MSLYRYLARRLGFAAVATWLVVTVMFCVVAFFPDPPNSLFTSVTSPLPGSPRDPSTPLWRRYLTWVVKYLTLDWGYAGGPRTRTVPVTRQLASALLVTGAYAVPALLASGVTGTLVGMHAALNRETLIDRVERLTAYVAFGAPGFFLAAVALYLSITWFRGVNWFFDPNLGFTSVENLQALALPAIVLAVSILAVSVRQVRSESVTYLGEDFVKLVRAQGGGSWLVGKHVLRNALAPLLSAMFSELLGIVVLSVVAIEVVFELPGYGSLLVQAATNRDPSLVMAITMVTVLVGIGGIVVQDLVSVVVDPRIDVEDR